VSIILYLAEEIMNEPARTTLGVLVLGLVLGCGGVTEITGAGQGSGGASPGTGGTTSAGGTAGSGGVTIVKKKDAGAPPVDAGNPVACVVANDCAWGEIDHEILAATDCMCLFGCPYIPMNQTTATRRRAQYTALCNPRYDGAGKPCPIDDCAPPPPIACVAGTCAVPSQRTGLACTLGYDCGSGYYCFTDVPGGYCVPGTVAGPAGCDPPACATGAVCTALPFRSIAGVCLATCTTQTDCRTGYVCANADPLTASHPTVCWTACQPGVPQSCNDNPMISSLHGTCLSDGTCQCGTFAKNPATGRCY
jgi:hypothetical protein